ncbi:MAG: NAD(P)H-hydrate dehydratase [Betaproteobacteria bacterium]|nr:NAD(P)H-hydrate dehydratase [Rhodocyclaceae bacterium]
MTNPAPLPPVLRVPEVRAVEAAALAGSPRPALMERAGDAAARCALDMLGGAQRVLVLAGPGNNGGDALVAARRLREAWLPVTVVLLGDSARLPADAAAALAAWCASGGAVATALPAAGPAPDLVVDGLLGIGAARPLAGPLALAVDCINHAGCPVLSLDVPSGLDADSGAVHGAAVRATRTLTFIALKPGLLTLEGPDHAGVVDVADLGLGDAVAAAAHGGLIAEDILRTVLPRRQRNSHKGSHGSVGILGGAPGMAGALLLAARAALLAGSGRVHAGFVDGAAPSLDLLQPELMLRSAAQVLSMDGLDVLVCGPGLGSGEAARACVRGALAFPRPLLLDADALNLVASETALGAAVAQRGAPTWVTPHPGEAARLLDTTTAAIAADRVGAALAIAARLRATTLLKGAGSIIAEPGGHWLVNASGNPGLAAAGTGDVLCGLAAALAAQGADPALVLPAAAHLHGRAADLLLEAHGGPVGMTAGEVALAARRVLNAALYG